jgi:uncharacterized membrane protein
MSIYRLVLGGGAIGAVAFTAVNTATTASAYYLHEVAWNLYGPSIRESPEIAAEVGLEKLVVYRGLSAALSLATVYIFSGSLPASLGFAVASNVIDAAIYAANEYGWYAYGPSLQGASGKVATATAEPNPRRKIVFRREEPDPRNAGAARIAGLQTARSNEQ